MVALMSDMCARALYLGEESASKMAGVSGLTPTRVLVLPLGEFGFGEHPNGSSGLWMGSSVLKGEMKPQRRLGHGGDESQEAMV